MEHHPLPSPPLRLLVVGRPERAGALADALEAEGFAVVALARDGLEAAMAQDAPACDGCVIELDAADALVVVEQIADWLPAARIVVLDDAPSGEGLVDVVRSGATGYLSSQLPPEQVARAVVETLAGRSAVSRGLLAPLVAELRTLDLG